MQILVQHNDILEPIFKIHLLFIHDNSISQYKFLYLCVQDYIRELMADEDNDENKHEDDLLIQQNGPKVKNTFFIV